MARADQAIIDAYLAELDFELFEVAPDSVRHDAVEEARFHLQQVAEDHQGRGVDARQAEVMAVADFGSPRLLAQHYASAWLPGAPPPTSWIRRVGYGNAVAFGWLGCATLVYHAAVQGRVFAPPVEPIQLAMSPQAVRAIVPEPIPFPDASPWFLFLVGFPLLAPWVIGGVVAWMAPYDALPALYRALLPVLAVSFLAGVLVLPVDEGLFFAAVQALLWLPAAWVAALATLGLRRELRKRRYARQVRLER